MLAIIIAAIVSLPIYPLNPVEEDTLSSMNIHMTAGFNGPNQIMSAGPEVTGKFEYLFIHPFFVRTSFDYRFGRINSPVYPNGDLHRLTGSIEYLYYRGTNKITAYLGLGIVYSMNSFNPEGEVLSSVVENPMGADDIDVTNIFGYRLSLGLRMHQAYTVEVGITEISPSFQYYRIDGPNKYTIWESPFRFNDFKISFGYLFNLR